jgi:hypothetical protein
MVTLKMNRDSGLVGRNGMPHGALWFRMVAMSKGVPLLPEDESFWYPNWRAMWDELDRPTRTRISRAVRTGTALANPNEARFAVTVAHRDRGIWRWWPLFSLIYVGIAVTWLIILSTRSVRTWSEWFLMISAALVVVVYAPLAYRRYRRAVTAERLNRDVVASQDPTRL